MHSYYIFNKPYQVLTQFSAVENKATLKNYCEVPIDVYPVGRLDFDSEGLVILTNDTLLNQRLLSPKHGHKREYWAQVEGSITQEAIAALCKGVSINVDGKPYTTKPCKASMFTAEPTLPERNPPIRIRQNIPTSWIKITLTEGKNRQVRKMTAAVGYPTLRLIRYRVESLTIKGLQPGDLQEVSKADMYKTLQQNP